MTTTKAIGYIRVSTDEQAREGVSLDAQEATLKAYCTMRGLELVELVIDAGVSAGKPLHKRQGGQRVLDAVASGEAQAVVAYKLDRLFRDCADCLAVVRGWNAKGIALHLVDMGGQTIDTSTAMGRFFLTVMAGAAELERNLIGERTKAALAHLRAQGVRIGPPALGMVATQETDEHGRRLLAPSESEQATVERIISLKAQGRTLREIAGQLTAEGRKTKRGGDWHASTVRLVAKRAA